MRKDNIRAKVAVLITGTYREIEFLLELLPYMAGDIDYDVFLCLRHVRVDETSRLGGKEQDFDIALLTPFFRENYFFCELPSIDTDSLVQKYLVPVGPAGVERECGMLSMFCGVFTGISMIKSSMRHYTHVMKIRTDYLPPIAPWISGMLEEYGRLKKKILVDGVVTMPWRYPDRSDIFWQGSISDLFCFASFEQFLALWDIEEILPSVWTGISETTLFRAAMLRFLKDDVQSQRRNDSFLKKYFTWQSNDTKQSFHMLRAGMLSKQVKQTINSLVKEKKVSVVALNELIRVSYDMIKGAVTPKELEYILKNCMSKEQTEQYLNNCFSAVASCREV